MIKYNPSKNVLIISLEINSFNLSLYKSNNGLSIKKMRYANIIPGIELFVTTPKNKIRAYNIANVYVIISERVRKEASQ